MAAVTWPVEILPAFQDTSHSYTSRASTIHTENDLWHRASRNRFKRVFEEYSLELLATGEERALFDAFWFHKLLFGSLWIAGVKIRDRNGLTTTRQIRFTTKRRWSSIGYDNWRLSISAEVKAIT